MENDEWELRKNREEGRDSLVERLGGKVDSADNEIILNSEKMLSELNQPYLVPTNRRTSKSVLRTSTTRNSACTSGSSVLAVCPFFIISCNSAELTLSAFARGRGRLACHEGSLTGAADIRGDWREERIGFWIRLDEFQIRLPSISTTLTP